MAAALLAGAAALAPAAPAAADGTVAVATGAQLLAAFTDPTTDRIELTADVSLPTVAERPEGSDLLVIDGYGHTITGTGGAFELGLFSQHPNELTVRDVTMTGFRQSAISWAEGTLLVDASTLRGNRERSAVEVFGTRAMVFASVFEDNSSDTVGGAVYAPLGGFLDVTGSVFTGNTARDGGAIRAGSLTVRASTFRDNEARQAGGAIEADDVSVTDSTFSGNTALAGGAIHSVTATVTGSTLADNTTTLTGGGLVATSEARLLRSTVTGNRTDGGGGGIAARAVELVYATVVGNTAGAGANLFDLEGAGLPPDPDGPSDRFLLAFGTVVGDPLGSTSCGGARPGPGATETLGANAEGGGDTCGFGAEDDQVDVADLGLGPLAANGGPTATRLPAAASPLVDAIASARCQEGPAAGSDVDQRGSARPSGAGCDIGAVERTASTPPPPPPVVTTTAPPAGTPSPGTARPAQAVAGSPSYTG